ncbi:MAG: PD-(D/E)XK nuclease family protein [Phycisphaerae bacterium]|nr:PD-(D/E)XK nuclease family protein [Phycisphaerae bacterium]
MDERCGAIDRVWLNCGSPPAIAAARWIVDEATRAQSGGTASLDLAQWFIVVPGARAGRLLMKALLIETSLCQRSIVPPTMATPGALIERLFFLGDCPPPATSLERQLAWSRALSDAPTDAIATLVPRTNTPVARDWLRLGAVAARLEDDLAAGGMRFEHAARGAEELGGRRERFDALAVVAPDAERILANAGLISTDEHRRRLLAAGEIGFKKIVVVGALDLGTPQRAALDRAAAVLGSGSVAVLVVADEARASMFDRFGCVTDAWFDADLPIANEAIRMASAPRDQAECALRVIADLSAANIGIGCDEVTVALADPELAAALRSAGHDANVQFHDAAGEPLLVSRPGRLLRAALPWVCERHPRDLAALVRLPIVDAVLRRRLDGVDAVASLDALRVAAVPAIVPATEDERFGDPAISDVVAAAVQIIDELFAPLTARDASAGAITALLQNAEFRWTKDDEPALLRLNSIVASVQEIPSAIQTLEPLVALELTIELSNAEAVPQEPRGSPVEAIGWLELLFEPAPHLVVLGMNADSIPSGTRHDPFLPDSLRAKLGLATRRSRTARDAALLDAVARRATTLVLIAGRANNSGDPLAPSPLLVRCRGSELAKRVRAISDPARALAGSRRWRRAAAEVSRFVVPEVFASAREVPRISVTSLKSYVESPYRFWLSAIERLNDVDDEIRELSPLSVGSLAHAALERFAKNKELCDVVGARTIEAAVIQSFDDAVRAAHGTTLLPAVKFQVAALRERLRRFAAWQALHRASGWRIFASEWTLPRDAVLTPAGVAPLGISGRVDRIDLHEETQRYRIIDYKTGESGRTPREDHRSGAAGDGEFLGFQLPLYRRFMAPALGVPAARIEVGYVRLPLEPARDGWVALDFSEAEHEDACQRATEIAACIRRGEFPLERSSRDDDPFRFLLQTPVFGPRLPVAEDVS